MTMHRFEPRPSTVSSVFANLERVLQCDVPDLAQVLLGLRWSFCCPRFGTHRWVEYSFPSGLVPFPKLLARRGGVNISSHKENALESLDRHLARGAPAIVAVDSYYLPYRPAYQRVHSSRTIIVRQGKSPTTVDVDDVWPPCYTGPLERSSLERARGSAVPNDAVLEPIFAGQPVAGQWFSVELNPAMLRSLPDRIPKLLVSLCEDAHALNGAGCQYGIPALRSFYREMAGRLAEDEACEAGVAFRREASLLLRAELSSRVYLCALFRAAAAQRRDTLLWEEVERYRAGLRNWEMARDLLTKSLTSPKPEYAACILTYLGHALSSEDRLFECVAAVVDDRTPWTASPNACPDDGRLRAR